MHSIWFAVFLAFVLLNCLIFRFIHNSFAKAKKRLFIVGGNSQPLQRSYFCESCQCVGDNAVKCSTCGDHKALMNIALVFNRQPKEGM